MPGSGGRRVSGRAIGRVAICGRVGEALGLFARRSPLPWHLSSRRVPQVCTRGFNLPSLGTAVAVLWNCGRLGSPLGLRKC